MDEPKTVTVIGGDQLIPVEYDDVLAVVNPLHPKYMNAHARRKAGLTWTKPKWKRKGSKRRGPVRRPVND